MCKDKEDKANALTSPPKERKRFYTFSLPGLGPGSAAGKKGKKRGQIGKILVSEASLAVFWGGGKRRRLFPLPRLPLGSLRSPIFFPFSPNAEPSLKLLSSLPFHPSIPVIFFCFFGLVCRTSQRTHPETLVTQQRN